LGFPACRNGSSSSPQRATARAPPTRLPPTQPGPGAAPLHSCSAIRTLPIRSTFLSAASLLAPLASSLMRYMGCAALLHARPHEVVEDEPGNHLGQDLSGRLRRHLSREAQVEKGLDATLIARGEAGA